MKNRYKITILFLMLITIFVLVQKSTVKTEYKKSVVVSTFALYDIVKHIAKDTLHIVPLLPFGVDPHEYEPTPKTMISIEKSKLFLYSGAGLEPWIHGLSFKNETLDLSKIVQLHKLEEHDEKVHEGHHHEGIDPHYWLDVDNMKKMTKSITKALIRIAPEHKKLYLKNEDNYLLMLNRLDAELKNAFSSCLRDTIIVNHNAFGYMAQRYGFEVESLSGLSPDAQANAKSIINLIKMIKEHNVSTIFFESFVSDKAMRSIAQEADTKVDVLLPLANVSAEDINASYEQLMKLNAAKLTKALSCH